MKDNTGTIQSIFEALPGKAALLNVDAPHFTLLAVTDAFAQATGLDKTLLKNKGFFDVLSQAKVVPPISYINSFTSVFQQVLYSKKELYFSVEEAAGSVVQPPIFTAAQAIAVKPVVEDDKVIFLLVSLQEDSVYSNAAAARNTFDVTAASYDLFQQAPVAICIVQGPEYVVKLVNEGMLQFLGRTTAMIGKPIIESLPEAQLQGLIHILDQVRITGAPYTISNFPAIILIDGVREARYFDLIFKPYFQQPEDKVPDSIFCVAHNITKQILDQKRIEENEEKYRSIFETMDQGFCIIELLFDNDNQPVDYRFLELNPVFEKQTGLKNAMGKTARELVPQLEPHWFEMYGKVALTGESIRFVEGSVAMGRWFEVYAFKMGGAESRKVGLLFTNITDRKHAEERLEEKVRERTTELENLNNELKRSNTNLEEFAYAASHDLKEPIRKIHFFSERIKTGMGDKMSAEEKRLFERMEAASKRMSSLIDDLLSYSQISIRPLHYDEVDMNGIIELVLEDLDLEIEAKNAVVTVDKLFKVQGHHRQLQQAFHNLIGNALKYTKPGVVPQIAIRCRKMYGNEANLNLMPIAAQKVYHLITVSDNGIGFEQNDAERIFNVFTRLHGLSEYRGTGVGLSIVRKVIENHNGYIWAEAAPGEGAAFHILLPAE